MKIDDMLVLDIADSLKDALSVVTDPMKRAKLESVRDQLKSTITEEFSNRTPLGWEPTFGQVLYMRKKRDTSKEA